MKNRRLARTAADKTVAYDRFSLKRRPPEQALKRHGHVDEAALILVCTGDLCYKKWMSRQVRPEISYPALPSTPLTRLHKAGLGLLLLLFIGFGFMVELRGAFQHTRKTDAGVYMRAAWAVRTGGNLYSVTDDRGWHYAYPPFLAILMSPMADPPHGASREGYMPYSISLGLWYVLTLAMGLAGVHLLANALEETSPDASVPEQPVFCRRWWAQRVLPLLILLPAIGQSQGRGQVGLPVAFFLCCAAACLLRKKRFRAGLWLSAAICIKLIPAFLLLFPLWRRDLRMLSGSLTGLIAGMIVIPVTVMGPARALDSYRVFYHEVLLAGVTGNTKSVRAKELTGITSTENNSPMAIMHNLMYPAKKNRPSVAARWVRAAHWGISLLLTAVALFASGLKWNGRIAGKIEAEPGEIVLFGTLIPAMLITSPVFHSHYVSMAIPLVSALLSVIWCKYSYAHMPLSWKITFLLLFISQTVACIDRGIFLVVRDSGLVLLSTAILLSASIYILRSARWSFFMASNGGGHAT